MKNHILIVAVLLDVFTIVHGYTCSCYCSGTYYGTASSSTCSSSSCQSACYSRYCYSYSSTTGSCSSADTIDLSGGIIAAIVIGSVVGLAICVGLVVVIICCVCKSSSPVYAGQVLNAPQQPYVGQPFVPNQGYGNPPPPPYNAHPQYPLNV